MCVWGGEGGGGVTIFIMQSLLLLTADGAHRYYDIVTIIDITKFLNR